MALPIFPICIYSLPLPTQLCHPCPFYLYRTVDRFQVRLQILLKQSDINWSVVCLLSCIQNILTTHKILVLSFPLWLHWIQWWQTINAGRQCKTTLFEYHRIWLNTCSRRHKLLRFPPKPPGKPNAYFRKARPFLLKNGAVIKVPLLRGQDVHHLETDLNKISYKACQCIMSIAIHCHHKNISIACGEGPVEGIEMEGIP